MLLASILRLAARAGQRTRRRGAGQGGRRRVRQVEAGEG
ncbi:hypothetical protein E2C01_072685 [Portunus trituberculatus]|uniref:Uncharacterized protein n=1 Tax=Portunus trituberculatus TaxID=210409 RepID=A0A5B7I7C4_PORTR|nr:hypothetical protein [Portunus trituberculatus]